MRFGGEEGKPSPNTGIENVPDLSNSSGANLARWMNLGFWLAVDACRRSVGSGQPFPTPCSLSPKDGGSGSGRDQAVHYDP